MSVAVEAQEVVASKDGVIVVRLTLYNASGVPLPLSEQPITRYQVWLLTGPHPRMVHACGEIGIAWGWADSESERQALSEESISDEILEQAFKQNFSSGSQDLSGVRCAVANVEIVDRSDVAIGKQFVRRWLLCVDNEDVSPLHGHITHSRTWNNAIGLGAQPRNPPQRKQPKNQR